MRNPQMAVSNAFGKSGWKDIAAGKLTEDDL